MLQLFYLDIAYVCNSFTCFQVFLQVFQMHVLSISSVFIRMLQMLHLDILKVDQVLHLSPRLLLPRLGVSCSPSLHPSQTAEGVRRRLVEGAAPGDGDTDASACSPLLYYASRNMISVGLLFF
jgi:hypothetical protein